MAHVCDCNYVSIGVDQKSDPPPPPLISINKIGLKPS